MGTTSQHQLAVFSSPVNGTSPIDANVVKGNDNSIRSSYNAHDADTTIHVQNGLVASRPSASTAGQMWLASDTSAVYLYLDTGSAWVDISYLKLSGGTLTGGLTISSGGITVTGNSSVTGTLTVSSTINGQTISSAANFTGSVTVASGLTVSAGTTAVQALTATTGAFSGLITATGGVQFTGGSALVPGCVIKTGSGGLVMAAATGSVFDFILAGPGGSDIIEVPTGTTNIQLTGNLTINTNKFTVTASNGNTAIAGALVVNGGSLNFSNFVGTLKIIGGTTGIGFRNNADSATIVNIDNAGAMNVSSDFSVATSKFTVAASTGNTVVAGTLSMTTASSKIIPGSTGLSIRNNADSADNLLISDAGVATHRGNVIVSSGGITVTGNSSVTGTLGVSSDFAVATTKFTVAASSGNTSIAGTLGVTSDFAVATSKFTVTASTGDATSAGIVGIAAGRADYRNTATVSVSTSATSLTSASAHGSLAFVNGTDGTNSFFDVVYFGKNTASVFTTTVGSSQIDLTGTVASRNFTCVAGVLKLQMGSGTYSVSVTELRSGNTGA